MDEDEPGEWVDGRIEEEEEPDLIHELVVSWLIHVLWGWLGQKGFVFGSDGKYAVRSDRGRKPDVAVYLHPGTRRPPARARPRSSGHRRRGCVAHAAGRAARPH